VVNAIARALGGHWEKENGIRVFQKGNAMYFNSGNGLTEFAPFSKLAPMDGKPMKDGDCEPYVPSAPIQATGKAVCGALNMAGSDGRTRWTFGGFKISSLASQLSRVLGIHVIDKTGITDQFVFTFEFARDADVDGQSVSVGTALEEQLGLKLTSTRAPRGFLVIDSIERPPTGGGRP